MYDVSNISYISDINYSNNTTVNCPNGWVYDFRELYPTIATEMNWVCDNDQLPYQSQTIFYVGTSLGCVVFGLIADRKSFEGRFEVFGGRIRRNCNGRNESSCFKKLIIANKEYEEVFAKELLHRIVSEREDEIKRQEREDEIKRKKEKTK
ncbi:carcinine transporter [Trichonephila clavipes]|nr:carcinine transporter [Trichonephila clavipes]